MSNEAVSFSLEECAGIEQSIDFLIACVSFEDRCTTLCKYLKEKGRVKGVFLYMNTDVSVFNNPDEKLQCDSAIKSNLMHIQNHLDSISAHYRLLESKHRVLSEKMVAIRTLMSELNSAITTSRETETIGVDATCFTRLDLLILLDYLYDYFPDKTIRIIYTRPSDHAKDWLTRGYSGIESILGYAGSYDYLKKTLLVILSGFEEERPRNFIDEYEADDILFGTSGKKPTKEVFGERALRVQSKFLNADNIKPFNFSADSIHKCFEDLETTLSPYLSDYNIVIAPLCTKLSVIASFLIAKKYPQIQLAYCYPKEYNWKEYSIGMDKVYIEDIERVT